MFENSTSEEINLWTRLVNESPITDTEENRKHILYLINRLPKEYTKYKTHKDNIHRTCRSCWGFIPLERIQYDCPIDTGRIIANPQRASLRGYGIHVQWVRADRPDQYNFYEIDMYPEEI